MYSINMNYVESESNQISMSSYRGTFVTEMYEVADMMGITKQTCVVALI